MRNLTLSYQGVGHGKYKKEPLSLETTGCGCCSYWEKVTVENLVKFKVELQEMLGVVEEVLKGQLKEIK